jgi:hypothetical protein
LLKKSVFTVHIRAYDVRHVLSSSIPHAEERVTSVSIVVVTWEQLSQVTRHFSAAVVPSSPTSSHLFLSTCDATQLHPRNSAPICRHVTESTHEGGVSQLSTTSPLPMSG